MTYGGAPCSVDAHGRFTAALGATQCSWERASHSAANAPPGFSRRSRGGPASATLPPSITMTRSQCMIVSSRCAIVSTCARHADETP
eukprot:5472768-Prymnesium_polylepis.1